MKINRLIIPGVLLLLLFFQNCGLSVNSNLGDLSFPLSGLPKLNEPSPHLGFPVSWSTDTGNIKNEDRIYENMSLLAENICILYSAQLDLEESQCIYALTGNMAFHNSVSALEKDFGDVQELDAIIQLKLIEFDTVLAEQCLVDLDANVINLLQQPNSNSDESAEVILNQKLEVIWQLLASNDNCKSILIPAAPEPPKPEEEK